MNENVEEEVDEEVEELLGELAEYDDLDEMLDGVADDADVELGDLGEDGEFDSAFDE